MTVLRQRRTINMSFQSFIDQAISPWMQSGGPQDDIVLSTRIRLARNLSHYPFPLKAPAEMMKKVNDAITASLSGQSIGHYENLQYLSLDDISSLDTHALVEKHLISPYLVEHAHHSGVLLSTNEQLSIMINEEDHLRMQLYFPGLQLEKALEEAFQVDDEVEACLSFAFHEKYGYLTTCPTNVGTGLRASVMVHLPALSMTNKLSKMIPAINQLGLVVRGIYGEGTEALGNIYQVSNQVTLGRTERDIIDNLQSVIIKLIDHERAVRKMLMKNSALELEDRIYRSYGVLKHSRLIESKEAAKCISDVRLGIDVGYITDISKTILSELMVLTQPAFLQQYAKSHLNQHERDQKRSAMIRERLTLEIED